MEIEKLTVDKAIRFLKAGYHLYTLNKDREERFYYLDNVIVIKSELKTLKINEYDFLSLYHDSFFYRLDDNNEDIVDIEKDKEYYSWRQ